MLHLTANTFEHYTFDNSIPVIVMFYANWCSKCAMMKPLIEDIEVHYRKQILFCEVDIDESKALAAHYGADIIPTFVFFCNGRYLRTFKGVFSTSTFRHMIEKYLI